MPPYINVSKKFKKRLKIDDSVPVIINKLVSSLNELIGKNETSIRIKKLTNELFETLKIIENCTTCKDNIRKDDIYEITNILAGFEKQEKECTIDLLDSQLIDTDFELNKEVLCEECKKIKYNKLVDECGN